MDDAFSALDPLIGVDMQTIVFVTHDLDEALRLGDSIAILRDSEIIQQGTSQDIVLRPANPYIESFVQEVNRGRVIRADAAMDAAQGEALPEVAVDGTCTLEGAGRLMVQSGTTRLAVRDAATGKAAGILTMERIMAAIPRRAADQPQTGPKPRTGHARLRP